MYVIYHQDCYDGWTAAWVAKMAHPTAVLLPATYGQPIPDVPDNSDVYMIDISFPRDQMEALASRVNLRVLDHHKTAQAALEGFPNCVFDMNRSGAMLAWNEFFPDEPAPWLVQYTQDRDLWRFALPMSREVGAFIESYPRDETSYDFLFELLENDLAQCAETGQALRRLKSQQVTEIAEQSFTVEIGGHEVPLVNATYRFGSEVANLLCTKFPEAQFAAYYFRRSDGITQFGLRSNNGFDVSEVAKQYGGGGHQAASGFEIISDEDLFALLESCAL